MKKSMLYTGIGYVLCGMALMIIALTTEFRLEGILWGFCGATTAPGAVMIYKYLHWSKPENIDKYNQMLKTEKIEMGDERKMMLRDKSGRITYIITLLIHVALIVIFSALSLLFELPLFRYATILFSVLIIFEYICAVVVFNHLNKVL